MNNRMSGQLHNKRMLMTFRDKDGVVLLEPESTGKEIKRYWTESECTADLKSFFKQRNMPVMVADLIFDLLVDLIPPALDFLNPSSSPGLDGILTAIYCKFSKKSPPQLMAIMHPILHTGLLNPDWTLVLLNPIPQARGIAKASKIDPLFPQNTFH